jgi:hypothetical protein
LVQGEHNSSDQRDQEYNADKNYDGEFTKPKDRSAAQDAELYETMKLLTMIAVWYISSSLANNLNKTILDVAPYPVTLTLSQFGFISLYCSLITMVFKLHPFQRIDGEVLARKVLPISTGHIFAHLLTQVSLQNVPVSFTHTLRRVRPFLP